MTAEASGAAVHTVLDTGTGLARLLVEVPEGSAFAGAAGPGGELWFVIAGQGQLAAGDLPPMPVRPGAGLWLPPGAPYRLSAGAPGVLRLDRVRLPAGPAGQDGDAAEDAVPQLSHLDDCPVEVTGDRRFRVLFGPGNGCAAATQFMGEIPPGRAPVHSHTYDEVVLVLDGEGICHAGPGDRPLAPGSCVHLPPGQPHCLENTGQATLRVLGVFHPGGSPAAKLTAPPLD
jgi:mannose-6-phosphate isomerase-like protein (cupin superfamily)